MGGHTVRRQIERYKSGAAEDGTSVTTMSSITQLLLALGLVASAAAVPIFQTQSHLAADEIILSTFDGIKSTTQAWRAVNDPVMGGQSTSSFQIRNGLGVFGGETKIVRKLNAPGFCNLQTSHSFADISSMDAIKLVVRSTVPYKGWKFAFGPAPRTGFFNSYKADFSVASSADSEFQTVIIPFNRFSSKWSSYTGEPTVTCASDKSVCPDANHLGHLTSLEITAEGVAGKFDLEVKSISAVKTNQLFAASQNIVELAASVKDLSTLVTALKAASLTTTLAGKGPFTVFAPTDEAFAKLPKATLDHLLEPKNIKELQAVLEYHVISGAAVFAKDLKPVQDVKTLEGDELRITELFHSVHVNFARVVKADVAATNGVVHVIDQVLIPYKKA